MKRINLLGVSFVIVSLVQAQECRQIEDPMTRLACYDQQAEQALDGEQNKTESEFGLPVKENQNTAQSIQSVIVGKFRGWDKNSHITLANGQVWKVVDGSSATVSMDDPQVTIESALFGGFFLRIEGLNKRPRVKRIK
jgi:hypothetical protein